MVTRKGFKIVTEPDYKTEIEAGRAVDHLICRVYAETDETESNMYFDFDLVRNESCDPSKVTVEDLEKTIIATFENEMVDYINSPTSEEIEEYERNREAYEWDKALDEQHNIQELESVGIHTDSLLRLIAEEVIDWGLAWRQRDKNLITDFDETEVTSEMINNFAVYYRDRVNYDVDGMIPTWEYPKVSPTNWEYALVYDTAIFGYAVSRGNGWDVSNAFVDGFYAGWAVAFFSDKDSMNKFIEDGLLYEYTIYEGYDHVCSQSNGSMETARQKIMKARSEI